jgi:hypothetical protein
MLSRIVTAVCLMVCLAVARVHGNAQTFELTVDAPPALGGVAARVKAIAPATVARALAHVGLDLPATVRIVLVDVSDPAAQGSAPWVVGSAFGTDTILIYPQRIGVYPYDSLESVVIHEMAHLALSARAAGRPLPRWFHEGVAVSAESGWGLGTQARLLVAAAQEPAIDDLSALFATEALPATTTAYLLSAALVEDVRRRHGPTAPAKIAARVAAGQSFEEAFVSETRDTPDEAAAIAWRVYRGLWWLPIVTSGSAVWGAVLALASVAFFARLRRRRQRRRQWELEERDEHNDVVVEPQAAKTLRPG